jgi:hypothetical protein
MSVDGSRGEAASVDLFWLPLGAGGERCVRVSGRLFEALVAGREHRARGELFHSALEVTVDGRRWVIEMAPVWGNPEAERGVVGEGAVGAPWLGRSRFFRYEIRRWADGSIPDVAEAVGGARRVSADPLRARRILGLVPQVPCVTWGRDEFHTGEMWNSNSLVAWALVRSGMDITALGPPGSGRAPGWHAGTVVAERDRATTQAVGS